MLAKTSIRDWILLQLDMANALRPGELFGLKWQGFDAAACSMTLTETTYKGKIRPWGKTRGSLTTIPIAAELAQDLVEWRKQCPDPSSEAFIFAAPRGGFMDSSNYRKRVLHKLAEKLGLPKLTFQVIRRTIATLAQKMGTVKDVQGILRHSRAGTTTDVYMQEIPEGVRATVNSIHTELKSGKGMRRTKSAGSKTVGSKPAKRNLKPAAVVTMTATTAEPIAASDKKNPGSVSGKVLEFATRMRQGRGREVALNA
ncbi:MAG: site-specific integrase [Acidobacteriaceae bacterium]